MTIARSIKFPGAVYDRLRAISTPDGVRRVSINALVVDAVQQYLEQVAAGPADAEATSDVSADSRRRAAVAALRRRVVEAVVNARKDRR